VSETVASADISKVWVVASTLEGTTGHFKLIATRDGYTMAVEVAFEVNPAPENLPYCGDGIVNISDETSTQDTCDLGEGLNIAGSGCVDCQIEDGWLCREDTIDEVLKTRCVAYAAESCKVAAIRSDS